MTRGQRGLTVTIQNILAVRRLKLDSRFCNKVVVLIFMLFFSKMSDPGKTLFPDVINWHCSG